MKKQLLKERFQQLAGIRPLYTLKESVIDNLVDKTKDLEASSEEQITSTVKSTIEPIAKSNEREMADIINNNPELSNDLGTLEVLQKNLEAFIQNYDLEGESSSLNESKGAAAGFLSKITSGMMALSAGMWAAVGLAGLGKEETIGYWDSAKNMLGKGLDYFSWTQGTIDQVEPTVEYLYGSPTQYAIATASLLAVTLAINAIKNKQQTNELTY